MTPEKAKQIAEAAWDEANAEAPPILNFADNAQYLSSGLGRMAFIAGYLRESIASLLQDHARPRLVAMDDRAEEPIEITLPLVVSGSYQPEEKATRDYPGCPEGFTIESMFIGGFELPDEIAAWIERNYSDEIEESILDRRASSAHDQDQPEFEVYE